MSATHVCSSEASGVPTTKPPARTGGLDLILPHRYPEGVQRERESKLRRDFCSFPRNSRCHIVSCSSCVGDDEKGRPTMPTLGGVLERGAERRE
jgi:hypothetical protein